MADFKSLLAKPTAEIKRPPLLPPGQYFGMITGREFKESSKQKTPFVQFTVRLTRPGEDIDPDMLKDDSGATIDVTKKTFSRIDFYLTEDAMYRLKELIESCAIPTDGRSLGECIPDLLNQEVMVVIGQETPQDRPEDPPFNTVKRIIGTANA